MEALPKSPTIAALTPTVKSTAQGMSLVAYLTWMAAPYTLRTLQECARQATYSLLTCSFVTHQQERRESRTSLQATSLCQGILLKLFVQGGSAHTVACCLLLLAALAGSLVSSCEHEELQGGGQLWYRQVQVHATPRGLQWRAWCSSTRGDVQHWWLKWQDRKGYVWCCHKLWVCADAAVGVAFIQASLWPLFWSQLATWRSRRTRPFRR